MPQMAPINWLTLLLVFSSILIIASILNYTLQFIFPKSALSEKLNSLKNWKW
uniref:ATP synthase complex subunit 8 n=1 Tax=Prosopocoilus astacoides TaxID=618406 RepID=A0A7H1DJI4_9SCAR|nr:ATP synthase F0 subunit 8 [Prosopocoilus astacoides]QNS37126.1 ATP synthase F0 subunit 8 [Prosopocoilus astacoides]UTM10017.1 ATP synthase F0 subunit 8 [Prosopocoilus astacoides castaneus]